ncbi:MAG: hypothetical protein GY860_12090 [Desulfobacteraceae bacterium]|nr:hypothetical protein [Desulfobacteraceae bacterium]
MQQREKNIYDKVIMGIAALIWVTGLLVAGSDSVYMPWLNAVGALLFLAASIWLGRALPQLEAPGSVVPSSIPVGTKVRTRSFREKQNSKVNTRYAGGWSMV